MVDQIEDYTVMNNKRFSPKVKQVISKSRDEAIRMGHDYIGTEHLLMGIMQENNGLAVRVLDSLEVDTSDLKQTIEDSISRNPSGRAGFNVGN